MSDRRVGPLLSLLREGVTLELTYGLRSVESLLRIAETVEESVYRDGSLERTDSGFRFTLANPPLRMGAFGAVRLFLDGRPISPESVRFRPGEGHPWRSARDLTPDAPIVLAPGSPVQIDAVCAVDEGSHPRRIRLEFESVAIPPLVWLEFRDALRSPGDGS